MNNRSSVCLSWVLGIALSLFAVSTPSAVSAQSPSRPSFGTSIALHVSAAIAGPVGTGAFALGLLGLLANAYGGSSDSGPWAAIAIGGASLVVVSIVLGISASVVHAHTHAELRRMSVSVLPLVFVDAGGGGGGLTLTAPFSL